MKNKNYLYHLKEERYEKCDNYAIQIVNRSSRLCFIFCSSNGIYTNVDENNYAEYIQKDYYEWKNISTNIKILKNACMYIFLRDVFQKSYVNWINSKINSIDKLIKFLKEKTKGYELIIVGNSGGGYLAIILGSQLENVKRVYSFGGLLSLYTWTGSNNNVKFEDTYKKEIGVKSKEKWFSIYHLLNNYPATLLLFYGIKHSGDAEQIRPIIGKKLDRVFLLKINSAVHSGHIPGYNYPKLLTADEKHLTKIQDLSQKEIISINYFSIKNIGFFKFLFYKIKSLLKKCLNNKMLII